MRFSFVKTSALIQLSTTFSAFHLLLPRGLFVLEPPTDFEFGELRALPFPLLPCLVAFGFPAEAFLGVLLLLPAPLFFLPAARSDDSPMLLPSSSDSSSSEASEDEGDGEGEGDRPASCSMKWRRVCGMDFYFANVSFLKLIPSPSQFKCTI